MCFSIRDCDNFAHPPPIHHAENLSIWGTDSSIHPPPQPPCWQCACLGTDSSVHPPSATLLTMCLFGYVRVVLFTPLSHPADNVPVSGTDSFVYLLSHPAENATDITDEPASRNYSGYNLFIQYCISKRTFSLISAIRTINQELIIVWKIIQDHQSSPKKALMELPMG